jgi:hypothetical protein
MLRSSAAGKELPMLLPNCQVQEMADGGMGSLRFVCERSDRRFGSSIAEAEFVDDDGVLVRIVVNVDERGELFELDIWKSDFSSLKRFPRPDDLLPSRVHHRKP